MAGPGVCAVAVIGATGRMGAALLAEIDAHPRLALAAAITRTGHPRVGQPAAAGQAFRDDLTAALEHADLAVDFALAEGIDARAAAVAQAGCAWVVGTTALTAQARSHLAAAAHTVAVLSAANLSLAVNASIAAAADLAAALGSDYDVDILDIHHRDKRDAPSGTALELGAAIAAARGQTLDELRWQPESGATRPGGRIAFAAQRAGSHPGEHRITFSGPADSVELTHRCSDRRVFARGALAAGLWLAAQPPGARTMRDFIAAGGAAWTRERGL